MVRNIYTRFTVERWRSCLASAWAVKIAYVSISIGSLSRTLRSLAFKSELVLVCCYICFFGGFWPPFLMRGVLANEFLESPLYFQERVSCSLFIICVTFWFGSQSWRVVCSPMGSLKSLSSFVSPQGRFRSAIRYKLEVCQTPFMLLVLRRLWHYWWACAPPQPKQFRTAVREITL